MTGQDPTGAFEIDTAKPHPARMYGPYLGGHFDPGTVLVPDWHPGLGDPVPGQEDGVVPGYGAVGREP